MFSAVIAGAVLSQALASRINPYRREDSVRSKVMGVVSSLIGLAIAPVTIAGSYFVCLASAIHKTWRQAQPTPKNTFINPNIFRFDQSYRASNTHMLFVSQLPTSHQEQLDSILQTAYQHPSTQENAYTPSSEVKIPAVQVVKQNKVLRSDIKIPLPQRESMKRSNSSTFEGVLNENNNIRSARPTSGRGKSSK